MTRVAVGAPVRNRAWVLPEYLAALEAIDHEPKQLIFLENDSSDGTGSLLLALAPTAYVATGTTFSTPPGHRRGEYGRDGYAHLANVRNQFIEMFLATDADYLLSVDSDIIVPPDILRRLLPLADERTIVAAAISNIAGRPLDGRTCGNFMVDQGGVILHPPSYPLSGVLEVDVVGACCLYPRALFESGVRWGSNPQGEDVSLCIAAKAKGFRILVTFDTRPTHRMIEV